MVLLSLIPLLGNPAPGRFFPHSGFLGISPVQLSGNVFTKLEEDRKALKAASVSVRVRCYEADVSVAPSAKGKNRVPTIIYELSQEIWRKPDDEEWGSLGDKALAWTLVLPTDAGGVTTTSLKSWKSWWQIEAVIDHKPSFVQGSQIICTHQLPLTRFSPSPTILPPPFWSSSSPSTYPSHPTKSFASPPTLRGLNYTVAASSGVLGPSDPLHLTFSFDHTPASLVVKKVQVTLDRRVDHDQSSTRSPRSWSPPRSDDDMIVPEIDGRSSNMDGAGSPGTSASVLALALEEIPAGRDVVLSGVLPHAKSLFRYSVGETMRTKLVDIQFTLSVKITVKTATGAMEVINLDRKGIIVTGASNSERELALNPHLRSRSEARLSPTPSHFSPTLPSSGYTSPVGSPRSSSHTSRVTTPGRESRSSRHASPARSDSDGTPPGEASSRPPRSSTRKRSDHYEGRDSPSRTKSRFDRVDEGAATDSASSSRASTPHYFPLASVPRHIPEHGTSNRRMGRQVSPYANRPHTSSGISASSQRSEGPSKGRFQREASAPLPSAANLAHDLLLPLSLYSTLVSDTHHISTVLPIPASPSMSAASSSAASPQPMELSPPTSYPTSPVTSSHRPSKSLASLPTFHPLPPIINESKDVARPQTANPASARRRSGGFSLFGKSVKEDEGGARKERWGGFLRRGKV